MAIDALSILTSISVLLMIGMLLSLLSQKIKVPDVLFLIFLGVVLSLIPYKGGTLMDFPPLFLTSISLLALAMIVFNSASKLKFREIDEFSTRALWLALVFLLLNVIILPIFVKIFFGIPIMMGVLFATIVAGTSPEITLSLFGSAKIKAIEILKFESLMNTPLTVLFPFLILDLMSNIETTMLSQFIDQLGPFLAKFVAGIGAGVLVGIILFKALRHARSKVYSPLSIIIGALLSYVLEENVGGNGVLAVTTLGLFVGNLYKREKVEEMLSFETILATSLYILVFVLIGFIIRIPFTLDFLWRASALLGIYFVVRYLALSIMFPSKAKEFKFKEKIFMTLNIPKGIAVAVVAFTLSTFVTGIPELRSVLDLTLFFMVCSIIFSTVTMFFSKKLIGEEVAPVK